MEGSWRWDESSELPNIGRKLRNSNRPSDMIQMITEQDMAIESRTRDVAMILLNCRPTGATICPSQIARVLAHDAGPVVVSGDWRDAMPMVHTVVDHMVAEGLVRLSWKGVPLAARSGPYRIARALA